MTVSGSVSPHRDLGRVREFLDQRDGPWSNVAPNDLRVSLYRSGYLSTMFRVDGAEEPYLVIIKSHDPGALRAAREFEVLSVLEDSVSPKALRLEVAGDIFSDPVLVTSFVEPVAIEHWDDANLDRLASLMAAIHTNSRLMHLDADRDCPVSYSISRELTDETRDSVELPCLASQG